MKINLRGKILRPFAKRFFSPKGKNDITYQERLLRYFIVQNTRTIRGKKYWFSAIKTMSDFQKQVPLSTYDDLQPYIESMLQWAKNILRYGKVPFFSKSSWTTATSKYIPITHEALKKNHYAVGKMWLGLYLQQSDESLLFGGEWLIMWWRLVSNPLDANAMNVWDVSAILQHNAPRYTKRFRKPSPWISFMENFDEKLDAMVEESKNVDITFIAWVPSWLTLFLQRVLEKTWKRNILEVRPHLELFLWWWINIAPYKNKLHQMMPWNQVTYWQNYNASEWFFAIQDKKDVSDMLLATHHHVLYEFIPFHCIDAEIPAVLLLQDLEVGKRYELIITTDGGLRRYRIGDVVEVTGVNPVRVRIAWRTKSFLNAFGEELMVHTTDAAIQYACAKCKLPLAEYVATAIVESQWWYHQWYIDFGKEIVIDQSMFVDALEEYIQQHNSDYAAKRKWDILMKKLHVAILQPWTFHRYMQSKGKLGGQHKMKRLWNEREELVKEMGNALHQGIESMIGN
jgi:GH3 auxin-responsive promoter